jgi:uncharacterized protein
MPSTYREAIAEYVAKQAKPEEKYGHQPRLYAQARLIGAELEHDDDVLYAAAWLHDLGVFIGHRPEDEEELERWDHVAYVIGKCPGILAAAGFPNEKIRAVIEAIRYHQPQDEPVTVEGIILRDADILEQLGAIGILRTVCKVGRDTRFPRFTEAVNSLRKAVTMLPQRITLDVTKNMARGKISLLQDFLEAIDVEAYGALL